MTEVRQTRLQTVLGHMRLQSDKQNASAVINRSTIIVATADCTVESHYGGNRAVYFLCGLFLVHFYISGRVALGTDIVQHPAEDGVSAVGDPLLKSQLHQFLCWGTHVLKPLSERHDCETHAFKVLHHLHSAPTVECYLTDIETLTEFFDELFDVSVVNDIAFGGFQIPLPLPNVIRHMITPDSKLNVILRYPEVWEDGVLNKSR